MILVYSFHYDSKILISSVLKMIDKNSYSLFIYLLKHYVFLNYF